MVREAPFRQIEQIWKNARQAMALAFRIFEITVDRVLAFPQEDVKSVAEFGTSKESA